MKSPQKKLPRDGLERLGMGLLAFFLFAFSCLMVAGLFLGEIPPLGLVPTLILVAAKELAVTSTFFSSLLIIWSVAMPLWVERIFEAVWNKLFLIIFLSVIPILVLMIGAFFGLRIGAGL